MGLEEVGRIILRLGAEFCAPTSASRR